MPEGGEVPNHCKDCVWKEKIQPKLKYALNDRCPQCTQRGKAGVPQNPIGHDLHRTRHLEYNLDKALTEIMSLVQPEFITRETESSLEKTMADDECRQVNRSLLRVTILTGLENTIWRRAEKDNISEEQSKRHKAGVQSVEELLKQWLMPMDFRNTARRMW
ncbi:Uu.00g056200.m01.CDS01 [Anthostomella pinea]|uniref:Uu.00g056200.m01.CDS01 n=1 Tax=Anthostomella pinea TaxID=933095 RepID=A0AAI8VRG5_9PEZI|nr:Uu.00g056200.m01.CDS01 [Anthostomella pinea]